MCVRERRFVSSEVCGFMIEPARTVYELLDLKILYFAPGKAIHRGKAMKAIRVKAKPDLASTH